ncbi:Peptide-O-fucosyltransferase [Zostera marina]|uniref:O-fucosyltransferase family protein n=1 Tax=Zostera marina TaxID=29655 RepID=A0A0K9PIV9_ZOSMR|nr:Peptide-O-fucosyltransferase [Zostera marina]
MTSNGASAISYGAQTTRRVGESAGKRGGGGGVGGHQKHHPRYNGGGGRFDGVTGKLYIGIGVLLICTFILFSCVVIDRSPQITIDPQLERLWSKPDSGNWRPSSTPRTKWPSPPFVSNGFVLVRCNGGLNQQRSAICNAVVAARIMNATLVLPELDTDNFWHDESANKGFKGIYDVEHFISTLRYDVNIVKKLPKHGRHRMTPFQLNPPRDAPLTWYTTEALKKMKKHGAVYLTPFSHRLSEEIDDSELQRLRCRVNYHALRFKPQIIKISNNIVRQLREEGHFIALHLRFEKDMLAFAGCFDIFNPQEQKILKDYREKHFAPKLLDYDRRRAIGKCPLTPEEVGLILRSMGFDNSTRIYIAAGEIFGGERFMAPFKKLFPRLENHNTVGGLENLEEESRGLVGSAVDYMVCLISEIFMPTYDGPSNFANNLLGHRLYYGFRTTIQPDRKSLAPIFINREQVHAEKFEQQVKKIMFNEKFGGPHQRVFPESFYTNSWPECFCQVSAKNNANKCPKDNVVEILEKQLLQKEYGEEEIKPLQQSNEAKYELE